MKIRCLGADACFNNGRTRALEQFLCIALRDACPNFGGHLPLADAFSLAQRSIGQRQPHAIVVDPEILGRGRHTIGRKILGANRLVVPGAAQHKRRTHDHAAATIKPFLLSPRERQAGFVEQRNLPLKFHFTLVTLLEFRPSRFGPKTPRRNYIEIISNSDSHVRN